MTVEMASVPRSAEPSTGRTAYGGHAEVSEDNRRRDPRFPLSVRVRYPRRNAFFFEYTRNISRGGMFIATDTPRPIGDRFVFEMEIPDEDIPIKIKGEVRWRVTPEDVEAVKGAPCDLEAGMGISFIYEDASEKAEFETHVMAMLNEAFGPEIADELLRTSPKAK